MVNLQLPVTKPVGSVPSAHCARSPITSRASFRTQVPRPSHRVALWLRVFPMSRSIGGLCPRQADRPGGQGRNQQRQWGSAALGGVHPLRRLPRRRADDHLRISRRRRCSLQPDGVGYRPQHRRAAGQMILAANDLGSPVTPTPGGWSGSVAIAATARQRKEDDVFLPMVK